VDDTRSGFDGAQQDPRSLDVDGGEARPVAALVRDDAGEVEDELAPFCSPAYGRRLEDLSPADPDAERPELRIVRPWSAERPDLPAGGNEERDEVASEKPRCSGH